MNDNIIRMAREAWLNDSGVDSFVRMAQLAFGAGVAEEREACAQAVEQAGIDGYGTLAAAARIRARGNQ